MGTVVGFQDDGASGANFNRQGWKDLMKFIGVNHSSIKYLLVSKYDRLSRDAADGIKMVRLLQSKYGIQVVSISEQIALNPNTPYYFQILAHFFVGAEVELMVIRSRVKMGIRNAKKQGRFIGTAPFGLYNARDESDKPIILIHKVKGAVILKIFTLCKARYTFSEISKAVREDGFNRGHGAVERALTNYTYTGLIEVPAYLDEPSQIVEGIHEAIVPRALFYEVQDIIQSGKRRVVRSVKDESIYLRGLINCEECKNPLTGYVKTKGSKSYGYLKCHKCRKNHSTKKIESVIMSALYTLSFQKEDIDFMKKVAKKEFEEKIKNREKVARECERTIGTIIKNKESLLEKYARSNSPISDDAYRKLDGRYERELADTRIRLDKANDVNEKLFALYEDNLHKLLDLPSLYKSANYDERRLLFRSIFGDSVECTEQGCRTSDLNPLFNHIALNINDEHIMKNAYLSVEIGQKAKSGGGEMQSELIRLLSKIHIAA